MKMTMKKILWIGLIASLLLSFSGISLRMGNEQENKSVIPVADYLNFYRAANEANINISDVLKQLKETGTKTIAVRETTLVDLNNRGDALVLPLAEYLANLQGNYSPGARNTRETLTAKNLNPSNIVVVSDLPGTISFLEERLIKRVDKQKIMKFVIDNTTIFYIDGMADGLDELGLGFDEKLLKTLTGEGFDVVLRPKNSPSPSAWQMEEYKDLMTVYPVKYVIFDGPEVAGYPENIDSLINLVKERQLIVGIIEPLSQVGYVNQKGLKELIEGTEYAVNRVYITPEKDLGKLTGEGLFHRWIRCVVDRNIRFIYIDPIKNQGLDAKKSLSDTLDSARSFNSFITSKGYRINAALSKPSAEIPGNFHYIAVLASLLLASALYLFYLLGGRYKTIIGLLLLEVVGAAAFIIVLKFSLQQFAAMTAAALYPSFTSLLVLKALKNFNQRPLMQQIPMLLGIMLGVNLLGGYTVVTTLADIRYTMNIEVFKGVLITFSIPLVLFVVNYFACFVSLEGFLERTVRFLKGKVSYFAALMAFVGALVILVYLARSGNDYGISASALELKVRDLLEEAMVARPRFKEFLIGYPALFAAAYLYKKYRKDILLLPLGMGIAMGCVSTVNSFCHVFTAVAVSAQRTLNGIALGILMGMATLAVIGLGEWAYTRWIKA